MKAKTSLAAVSLLMMTVAYARLLAQDVRVGDEVVWPWPKTLEAYPSHPGDPVKLVRIMKDGKEIVPGTYELPKIAGDLFQNADAFKEWLRDFSFTLKSQTAKNIVSVAIAAVMPVRSTDIECGKPPLGADCTGIPHWCDDGCPTIFAKTLHWGRIPAVTLSGLEARYRAQARGMYGDRVPLQGKGLLRLAGEEITLLPVDRSDGIGGAVDPRHGFSSIINGILWAEGIDEARNTDPCVDRAESKTGCAFAEVSKFNIGVDVVYFDDGTIWGNYGYGYAVQNSDGIFARVDAP